jgi:hypothetical protein
MKMYEALANVAEVLNRPQLPPHVLDFQTQRYDTLVELLPSGSGFDNGTEFISIRSGTNRLVFRTAFHHTDEHGSYTGWSQHDVIVTASLSYGFEIRVTGKDRDDIKEYIAEVFQNFLHEEAPW